VPFGACPLRNRAALPLWEIEPALPFWEIERIGGSPDEIRAATVGSGHSIGGAGGLAAGGLFRIGSADGADATPALRVAYYVCFRYNPENVVLTIQSPRFFDEVEVRARLRMADLIEAMQRALVEFSGGTVKQPVRTVFAYGAERSVLGVMPSYVPSLPALGAKLVTVCARNTERGLGTHQAVIVMLDPETGVVNAIMDGRYITEARTAAVSAVSARLLARQNAQVLGILGSGVQARSHLEALSLVREFREVRVWSPTASRLRRFAEQTGVRAMESAEAVVREADVVVTVTASPTPVVENEWVAEGTHLIAVGSCAPSQRELDPALVARARLVVDSRAAALKEAGDVVMGIAEGRWTAEHIAAELGELPARRDDREITVFKSLGLAVEDLFAAHLVLTDAGS